MATVIFVNSQTAATFLYSQRVVRQSLRRTKSDKATKSSKALGSKAKGQKVQDDSTSLFTTCSDVQAKLDTCEAAATAPSWLVVQMADMCTLYRDRDGVFYLESNKFHQDTEWFTDRPLQLEKTEPTSEWFNNFNEMFDDENEKGMPNAALTIVDDDTSQRMLLCLFLLKDTSRKERVMHQFMDINWNNPLSKKVFCH